MNKIHLIGNMTRDPEIRMIQTANGETSVCNVGLAVQCKAKGQDGKPKTEFFTLSVWGKRGEAIAKYTKKGSKIGVVGELTSRQYVTKTGETRFVLDVAVEDFDFCSTPNETHDQGQPAHPQDFTPVEEEELPF